MKWIVCIFVLVLFKNSLTADIQIPEGFLLGVASAAYQVEGGWNASGKGENIWDRLTHTRPDLIADNSTGDISCDSYHLWEEDVKNLVNLGVDHYRFSLSWSRLLPTGFSNYVNPDGVRYYNDLIDALIENNIIPMVTLYHWDLPEPLQEIGGWINPRIVDYFTDYARVAYELFGDRVKLWLTVNEPPNICTAPYEYEGMAPVGVMVPGIGLYLCGRYLILGHASAYRLYESEYKEQQGGRVGVVIDAFWTDPKTNTTEDEEANFRGRQMGYGWWSHPIFSEEGDYHPIMKSRIDRNSELEHFSESRLPPFTQEEVEFIRGSYDYFGLNFYFSYLASYTPFDPSDPPSYDKDKESTFETSPVPGATATGLRKLLNWIKDNYNDPAIIITETGYPDNGPLQDDARIEYIRDHLKNALLARIEDGVNLEGYTHWSLMDNMEWRSGYTTGMGLYDVDFNDPNRKRTPKASAGYFKNLTSTRVLPDVDI